MDKVEGGEATPIYIISDADLEENGGNFKVEGGSAIPVYFVSTT